MKRTWLIAAVAAHAAGCSDTTTTTLTELNLDRPIDVSFACYGQMRVTNGGAATADQDRPQTAQPIGACEQLSPQVASGTNPVPLTGQETIGTATMTPPKWYAFILQSTAGTVAIGSWHPLAADATGSGQGQPGNAAVADYQVLDADPLTPGKNAITIGEDPIAIVTDPSGCYEVTANAGSCDLSELNINSALDRVTNSAAAPIQLLRRPVVKPDGSTLLARPAAMIVEPGATAAELLADPSKMGHVCPAAATGVVYIAYPSCHLVAGVEAATGKLVSGIQFDASGAVKVLDAPGLAALSCPVECVSTMPATADPTPAAPRPVTLAYRFDPRPDGPNPSAPRHGTSRLAIGADNSNVITVVDLDLNGGFLPGATLTVPLQLPTTENASRALGITSVALSAQIGLGGNFNDTKMAVLDSAGDQTQYVYAVASDATVRVADVLLEKRECDTQIDGRAVRARAGTGSALTIRQLACMEYATPALPRRVGASGPGIELPLLGAPGHAVPLSVAIVHGRNSPGPVSTTDATLQTPAPAVWLGHFAAISSSTGDVYVANIDDDYAPDTVKLSSDFPLEMQTSPVLVMAHQLRDGFTARDAVPALATASSNDTCHAVDPTGGVLAGGPRATTAPAQTIPANTLTDDKKFELPTLQSLSCPTDPGVATVTSDVVDIRISQVQFGAPSATRDQVFPDLGSTRSETWTMTYESTLSLDGSGVAVDGPPVRHGQIAVDKFGMTLNDPARPFCDMGVQPFDIVELRGCNAANGDLDCPSGYVCFVHPKSAVSIGACMLKSEAPRLADGCEDFLTTQRIYTAGTAADGSVVLLERKHELPNTPIDGCNPDPTLNQCNLLASLAHTIGLTTDLDPIVPSQPNQPKTNWACRHDSLRAPVNADPAKDLRCIQTCDTNPDSPVVCSTGTVCRHDTPTSTSGVCMEGVEPPQACVQGPQSYAVRASEAFTVIGSLSGYVHPVVRQANGSCSVPSATASTLQTGRIPLRSVPDCGTATGPNRPNPCLHDPADNDPVLQFDFQPEAPFGCADKPLSELTQRNQLMTRKTRGIEFRNAALAVTMVDPYKDCALDLHVPANQEPKTTPVTVPMVPRGYELKFVVRGGLTPFTLPLSGAAILPGKVLRGPSDSIWVIDEGDFLGISQPTRGQVFRFESTNVNAVNALR